MSQQRPAETEAGRRRRAAAFGEVLPEQTADDRDPPDPQEAAAHEAWLRAQVPPHHG